MNHTWYIFPLSRDSGNAYLRPTNACSRSSTAPRSEGSGAGDALLGGVGILIDLVQNLALGLELVQTRDPTLGLVPACFLSSGLIEATAPKRQVNSSP